MALERLTWTAFPEMRLLEQRVYFLSCVRGLSTQCELVEDAGFFEMRRNSGEPAVVSFFPVTREVRELEEQTVAAWRDWAFEVAGGAAFPEARARVDDASRGLGLSGSLSLRLSALGPRQRILWTALLASVLRQPGVLVLMLSSDFSPENEKESRALHDQLARLASTLAVTIVVAGTDRRAFSSWDCIEFRGYPRSLKNRGSEDFDDSLEADDAA